MHTQDGVEAVEHMNILPASRALDHVCFSPLYDTHAGTDVSFQLNTSLWHKAALGDKTLLPLGLSPDDLN